VHRRRYEFISFWNFLFSCTALFSEEFLPFILTIAKNRRPFLSGHWERLSRISSLLPLVRFCFFSPGFFLRAQAIFFFFYPRPASWFMKVQFVFRNHSGTLFRICFFLLPLLVRFPQIFFLRTVLPLFRALCSHAMSDFPSLHSVWSFFFLESLKSFF